MLCPFIKHIQKFVVGILFIIKCKYRLNTFLGKLILNIEAGYEIQKRNEGNCLIIRHVQIS